MEKRKLTIELVPQTAWYTNVRSNVSTKEWDYIRKKCYSIANNRCEICNGKGPKHPVECHEIWDYDDDKHKQTLTGLIALCPNCHMCKHIGLAEIQGKLPQAIKHLSKINEQSENETLYQIEEAFETWSERSKYDWKLDITYLEQYKTT